MSMTQDIYVRVRAKYKGQMPDGADQIISACLEADPRGRKSKAVLQQRFPQANDVFLHAVKDAVRAVRREINRQRPRK
jgi:hypothetical protein